MAYQTGTHPQKHEFCRHHEPNPGDVSGIRRKPLVTLNRIYTRTGDTGTTSLADGSRESKATRRVDALGNVDELNAFIGLALAMSEGHPVIASCLQRIQGELFDLGADLARPKDSSERSEPSGNQITQKWTDRLEQNCDDWNRSLSPLRSFILPGGNLLAAHLHCARTISRRAERSLVHLAESGPNQLNPLILQYINRLTDLLFIFARVANNNGQSDILWIPGGNNSMDSVPSTGEKYSDE